MEKGYEIEKSFREKKTNKTHSLYQQYWLKLLIKNK